MNRCDTYLTNLSMYLDGELSETETKDLEIHLQECDACAKELEILSQIISACSELEEELPEGFEASLHNRLLAAKEEMNSRTGKVRKIRMITRIAAGFVLVFTLGLFIRTGLLGTKMSGTQSANDMKAPMAADEGSAENSIMMGGPVSVRMAPDDTERASTGKGIVAQEEKSLEDNMEIKYFSALTEACAFVPDRVEGHDTVVRLTVEDVDKALESIRTIEVRYGNNYSDYWGDLAEAMQIIEKDNGDELMEIKLSYPNDELWHEFLSGMQNYFPDMQVESLPSTEDQEYIRIIIRKVR